MGFNKELHKQIEKVQDQLTEVGKLAKQQDINLEVFNAKNAPEVFIEHEELSSYIYITPSARFLMLLKIFTDKNLDRKVYELFLKWRLEELAVPLNLDCRVLLNNDGNQEKIYYKLCDKLDYVITSFIISDILPICIPDFPTKE